jgi:hypothetical protein
MATIRAAIPGKLLSQLRAAADPDESVEDTVQGAIQATLPTAEVRYFEDGAEVVIQIADEEIVSALFGLAVYELQDPPVPATDVKPEAIQARDAR